MLFKRFQLPFLNDAVHIVRRLSPLEKVVFYFFVTVFTVSGISLVSDLNNNHLVGVPARGGSLSEGIIGSPRFINPILAVTDADRDLTQLLYSGLMRPTTDGMLVPDLAQSISISDDGLVYRFILRNDIFFHDNTKVTVDDVLFTIAIAQDPTIKSPKRASWDGVTLNKISEREVEFILEQPYVPFLQNTTLGILPKHIWDELDAEKFTFSGYNTKPIGSGPYKIHRIKTDSGGVPEYYELSSFSKSTPGEPYIPSMTIHFYSSENELIDAYLDYEIDIFSGISSKGLAFVKLNSKSIRIERSPLPRIFAVFLNQNQRTVLANIEVRKALDLALDKERVVREALGGNGTSIESPIPPGVLRNADALRADTTDRKSEGTLKGQAIKLLEKHNWSVDEETGLWQKKTKEGTLTLSFSLSTSDVPELKQAANIIKDEWQSIGVDVDLKIFESGDLNQNVIRPRKYDALLFGEIVGRELDLFAFWHSSQRNDPGLNIALYANITSDALLEDARVLSDENERLQKYIAFEEEVANDIPAIFVYAPDFIYVVEDDIKGLKLSSITTPSERFLNVHEWYFETDRVWSLFVK